jgi:hypothetical protein
VNPYVSSLLFSSAIKITKSIPKSWHTHAC